MSTDTRDEALRIQSRERLRQHVMESIAKSGSGAVLVSAATVADLFADFDAALAAPVEAASAPVESFCAGCNAAIDKAMNWPAPPVEAKVMEYGEIIEKTGRIPTSCYGTPSKTAPPVESDEQCIRCLDYRTHCDCPPAPPAGAVEDAVREGEQYVTADGRTVTAWRITADDGVYCSDLQHHCASTLRPLATPAARQGGEAQNPPGFGIACTVAWTELVQAMRADGHDVKDKSGPNTRKWMESMIRDTLTTPPAREGVPEGWTVERSPIEAGVVTVTSPGGDWLHMRDERLYAMAAHPDGERCIQCLDYRTHCDCHVQPAQEPEQNG